MMIDRLSKRDFFKILGGGSAAAAIATGAASGTPPEVMVTMRDELPSPDGKPMREPDVFNFSPHLMDVEPYILWARFRAHDFVIRNEVHPFSQHRFPDPSVTNIDTPNSLYAPTSFVIGGIMVLLDRDVNPGDQAEFERSVRGGLELGMKHFEDFPMARITQRAHIEDLVKRDSNRPTDFVTSKMFRCDPPHVIPSLMYFDFVLRSPDRWRVPESLGGYILFDGMIARAVQ